MVGVAIGLALVIKGTFIGASKLFKAVGILKKG